MMKLATKVYEEAAKAQQQQQSAETKEENKDTKIYISNILPTTIAGRLK